jgi:uncharacterized protein YlxW (UPF0749 family)
MTLAGRRLALVLGGVLIAALLATLLAGAPERLPAVALGSVVLLHIERAAAMFAIVLAVVSVVVQASRGRLPTQVTTGGLAYEAEAAADTKGALENLQAQIDDLQDSVDHLASEVLSLRSESN